MCVLNSSDLTGAERSSFLNHTAPDGGPWERLQVPDPTGALYIDMPLQALCGEWSSREYFDKNGKLFRCFAGYSNNTQANGACSIEKGNNCVSLTYGYTRRMQTLAHFCLSSQAPNSHSSNKSAGDPNTNRTLFGSVRPLTPIEDWVNRNGIIMSPDTYSNRLMYFLHTDLVRLAWYHEIFHCLLGHTSWLSDGRARLRIVELDSQSTNNPVDAHIVQALEHQADHAAIRSICLRAIDESDPFRTAFVPELSDIQRMGVLQFAAGILSAYWTSYARQSNVHHTAHPKPQVRYLGLLSAVRQSLIERDLEREYTLSAQWAFDRFAILAKHHDCFSPLASLASKPIFSSVSKERSQLLNTVTELEEPLSHYAFETQ